jgi:hypothetical protein
MEMNKAADTKPTTSSEKVEPAKAQPTKEPFAVFSSALLDIGWKLGAMIILPLWIVSATHKEWFNKPAFGLLAMVWIAASFSAIVYSVLRTIPKSLGGLQK